MTDVAATKDGMTDREMDALVAEKVMGCPKIDYEWSDECEHEIASDPKCSRCIPLCMCPGDKHGSPDIPYYSTDIAAAFEVVGNLRDRFPQFVLYFNPRRQLWECEFTEGNIGGLDTNDESPCAETAAEAICLAALEAALASPATPPAAAPEDK